MKDKVYSVVLRVAVVVHAKSREEAALVAMEHNNIGERLQSLAVESVFCPAEGK